MKGLVSEGWEGKTKDWGSRRVHATSRQPAHGGRRLNGFGATDNTSTTPIPPSHQRRLVERTPLSRAAAAVLLVVVRGEGQSAQRRARVMRVSNFAAEARDDGAG